MVIIAYLMTNRFLNHRFLFYGFETWLYYRLPPEEMRLSHNTNPMCNTFPRIAACDYHRFGSGGVQEKVNAICILNLNIINDKVTNYLLVINKIQKKFKKKFKKIQKKKFFKNSFKSFFKSLKIFKNSKKF
jgi:hypothetical protein